MGEDGRAIESEGEYGAWAAHPRGDLEVTCIWVDGVYVKAGLEKEQAASLATIGAFSAGGKVVHAEGGGHWDIIESWSALPRKLQ